jgi:hypothetical protein
VAAAITAYGQIADEALGQAGSDPSLLDLLRLALDRHLAVLEAVAATAPTGAQAAIERNIERAVERNDATLLRIGSSPLNGNQGGGSNTQPAVNQGHDATHAPAATPDTTKKPHPTVKPTPTPDPTPANKTPAPTPDDHQGGGKPSPKPPGHGTGPST